MKAVGITAKQIPTMSVSIAEPEIAAIGPDKLVGHHAVWNYFQTTSTPELCRYRGQRTAMAVMTAVGRADQIGRGDGDAVERIMDGVADDYQRL